MTVTAPGPAVRITDATPRADPAPGLAGDLVSVMAEIGIDREELAALQAAGIC